MKLLKKLFKEEIFPYLFAINNVAVVIAKSVAFQVCFRIVSCLSSFRTIWRIFLTVSALHDRCEKTKRPRTLEVAHKVAKVFYY